MGSLTLLDRAKAAGLTVSALGDRLIIKGPRSAEPVARELMARKAEVIAELAALSRNAPRDDQARPAAFRCATCEDSGEVAPSAFVDDREPWPRWIERTGGNPMIHPVRCPSCHGAARLPVAATTRPPPATAQELPFGPPTAAPAPPPPPATELAKDDSIRVTKADITILAPDPYADHPLVKQATETFRLAGRHAGMSEAEIEAELEESRLRHQQRREAGR
jgi:hypothetical protein